MLKSLIHISITVNPIPKELRVNIVLFRQCLLNGGLFRAIYNVNTDLHLIILNQSSKIGTIAIKLTQIFVYKSNFHFKQKSESLSLKDDFNVYLYHIVFVYSK